MSAQGSQARWPATAQSWVTDVAIAVALGVFGIAEALRSVNLYAVDDDPKAWTLLFGTCAVALGFAAAAGCYRRAPGIGLLLVWLAGAYQLFSLTPVMVVQLSVVVVAFGTARYGSTATLWASALSIPLGGLSVMLVVRTSGWTIVDTVLGQLGTRLFATSERTYGEAVVIFAGLSALILAVPWLVGLVLRIRAQARANRLARERAEAEKQQAFEERTQAQEVARLKDDQARLARDVHDVVGHSLAVILAQAESAQFLPDADPTALRSTMATIAESARSSLQDVRQVLSTSAGQPAQLPPGELERIINGVAASGHEVVSRKIGTPQPLPPELDLVAVRVLQEMLTNAIKHGRRDQPVEVDQHWDDGLRIQVRNVADQRTEETMPIATEYADGLGLEGMRRRLDSVGGRLDVVSQNGRFTATAWVPLRSGQR
jgi:signal transduction histidine kinase